MQRALIAAVVMTSAVTLGQVSFNNDIVVVADPSGTINGALGMGNMNIFPSKQEQFCRAAFNAARAGGLGDNFDGIVSFTTSEAITDLDNVWQGPPVRSGGANIGRDGPFLFTSSYNSQKLSQCVFMGTLGRPAGFIPGFPAGPESLPADPEAAWAPSLGVPIPGVQSLSGIEMMGHEYGHHWLNALEFDQADGRGRMNFIRGFGADNMENGQMGLPNQHYSHLADSRSVMYGECITDLGNGSFRFEGCARKYSHLDQYLMGLRGACEVAPMMVLEDPTNPGKGQDVIAMGRNSPAMTRSGLTRHDITIEEVQRAMGVRSPKYPAAKSCWRVAFVVVLAPGQTAVPAAMLAKVERYRQRWNQWFSFATDGRGVMQTNVTGPGCPAPQPAADPCEPDAGVTVPDAGEAEPDGGSTEADGGQAAGPAEDGGEDGGVEQAFADAGRTTSECLNCDLTRVRDGCGCGATDAFGVWALGALLAVWSRRRR